MEDASRNLLSLRAALWLKTHGEGKIKINKKIKLEEIRFQSQGFDVTLTATFTVSL